MSVRSFRTSVRRPSMSVRNLRWSVRSASRVSVLLAIVLVACADAGPTTVSSGPTSDSPGPTSDSPGPTGEAQTGPTQTMPALKFDGARAWEHLTRQVALGSRFAGSPAAAQTRQYILAELKAAGIESREQAFESDTPAGP